ncbi:MAG: hypothetical protein IPO80_13165 [Propionibacteriaceae bacterium]|nr:hypothetical protein [Propionibacteriaceae bacterium]
MIVENMPEKWKLMILPRRPGALRYGEIAELRRQGTSSCATSAAAGPVIQVRRGVVWENRKIQVEPPKSEAGIRDVAIPPHPFRSSKSIWRRSLRSVRRGTALPAANGRQQWPSTITASYFREVSDDRRTPDRFHDLRHTTP